MLNFFIKKPCSIVGIHYAKPPVGELRFKRPEEFPAWSGEMDATKSGNACPQMGFASGVELGITSKGHYYPI